MTRKLLDVLLLRHCSHQFGWPRRWPDGEYYQVCLLCGDEYKYDWKHMRRTELVPKESSAAAAVERIGPDQGRRCSTKKVRWTPRARRLKVTRNEIRYRRSGTLAWEIGTIENISASGVLFRAERLLDQNSHVDLVLEMPQEITGQKNSTVLCSAFIVRATPSKGDDLGMMAATIADYKFLERGDVA